MKPNITRRRRSARPKITFEKLEDRKLLATIDGGEKFTIFKFFKSDFWTGGAAAASNVGLHGHPEREEEGETAVGRD